MKKILLGTTGLIGAALLATAANAETPKVTLGGFADFQAGYTSDDFDNSTRAVGFRNDNTVTVRVDGKTNGGLGYGAVIDLEADATNDADSQGINASRTFTYLGGNWGRFEMGSVESSAATMRVDASTLAVATGGINGAWTYFINPFSSSSTTNGANFISTSKLVSEHGKTTEFGDESTYNATKINYYTPKFSGFQAGVSYTPSLQGRGQSLGRTDESATPDALDQGNVFNGALSYDNTFNEIRVALAATGEIAKANDATVVANEREDIRAWNVGALAGFQGFSVAGSYGNWGDSGQLKTANGDAEYWTVGGGYEAGPIGLSVTYLDSAYETSAVDSDFSNIVVGADYKLAPGLTPYAEVSFYDADSAGTTYDNKGTTFLLGTQVAF
jgi:predicted porin